MADISNEVTVLGRELEEKYRKVDSIIATMNRKLAALKFELEVWLEDKPMCAGDYDYTGEHGEEGVRARDAVLLGWGDIGTGWQLTTKVAILRRRTNMEGKEYEEVCDVGEVRELATEPEFLHLDAVRLLPVLLASLQKKAKSAIKDIEEAERVVEAL